MQKAGNMHKRIRIALGATASIILLIQFVPVDRGNPPVTSPIPLPDEVRAVVQQSCFDCHSNETRWPWYAYVAPVSWLVAHDVEEARGHVNFSEDGAMSAEDLAGLSKEIWEEVEEGEMPLPKYLLMHPDARLTDEDKATLEGWAGSHADGESSGHEHEDRHEYEE